MLPFAHRFAPVTLEDNPLWLIVLADVMTNLMLMFLGLSGYAVQNQLTQEKFVETFQEHGLVEPLLGASEDVADDTDGIRLRLRGMAFETNEDRLAPESGPRLGALAQALKRLRNNVVIEGHTDSLPILGGPFRTNWELSVARSNSVIEALVAEGVEPRRLIAAGYGPLHPVGDNATVHGRSLNRRVEVVVLREVAP